jgi:hypothetical protein
MDDPVHKVLNLFGTAASISLMQILHKALDM